MKLSVGDKIRIHVDVEEMQNDLLEMVDGQEAVVTEIYQNSYEPDVDRIEVELVNPVEFHGQNLVVVPGLYMDNIEKIEKIQESKKTSNRYLRRFVGTFANY
jgi:methionine synthase II (cobalamin-independent)